MRIGIVVRAPGASARVRALQFVPGWEHSGAEVRVLPWDAPVGRVAVARRAAAVVGLGWWADVVLLQKPVLPPPVVRALAAANRRLVVDLDDATWVSATTRRPAPGRVAQVTAAATAAAAVVVGSEHLATMARDLVPSVDPLVLRPAVDLRAVRRVEGRPAGARPVVGWIGSPGNVGDLGPEVRSALARLVADGTVEVHVITGAPVDLGFPHVAVDWSLEREAAAVAALDVGLMPLADDPRSAGRCGYKALQSMAAGAPVVASPVGVGPELVRPGRTGYLATSAGEWAAALRLLAGDAATRRRLGAAGRALVEREADAAPAGEVLGSLLGEVARRPRWW